MRRFAAGFITAFVAAVTLAAASLPMPAHAASASAESSAAVDGPGRVMGDPDAPITIVEFASLTCPHCARFHTETLPKLKKNWIEPGKAKLVFRHYPLDRAALRGAMLANCFKGKRFFAVLDMMFSQQRRWARAEEPVKALGRIAATAGMSRDEFKRCVNDKAMANRIVDQQLQAKKQVGVKSTPTFLVNGKKLVGNQGYEAFAKTLRRAGP